MPERPFGCFAQMVPDPFFLGPQGVLQPAQLRGQFGHGAVQVRKLPLQGRDLALQGDQACFQDGCFFRLWRGRLRPRDWGRPLWLAASIGRLQSTQTFEFPGRVETMRDRGAAAFLRRQINNKSAGRQDSPSG